MPIIIEYQYFSPVILFKTLCTETHLVFEQYETYQKTSFRNRCMVAGANGPITLTIPLEGGRNQKRYLKDVRIDNSVDWKSHHWKTIVSCYKRSPWFEYYSDELESIYKRSAIFLNEWNLICFEWTLQKLNLEISVSMTVQWNLLYDFLQYDDWRNRLLPNSIHADFLESPKYKQVFEERNQFIPHLSILDLLFCEGKNARSILCQ